MKKLGYSRGTLVLFLLLLVVFPGVWFFLDKSNFLSKLGIISHNNPPSEWSTVFIGYFGSAFAAIAGYIAVVLSLKIQDKARREDKAKEVLPLILALPTARDTGWNRPIIYLEHVIRPKDENSSTETEKSSHLSQRGVLLKNAGLREMYDVEIVGIESEFFTSSSTPVKLTPILYKDSGISFDIMLTASGQQPECVEITNRTFENKSFVGVVIDVAYKDCYDNHYIQRVEMKLSYNFEARNMPGLIFSGTGIEDCSVVSAPLLQN